MRPDGRRLDQLRPIVLTRDFEAPRALTGLIAAQERLVKELLPRLREAGARGIVEYPLSKIIE